MDVDEKGRLFPEELMNEVRGLFCHIENDPLRSGKRIYFDNAGGSFRLKTAVETFCSIDSMPDCPERAHQTAGYLKDVIAKGEDDIRVILNAKKQGRIVSMLTASQVIFSLTGAIAENVPGGNIVTTKLEHPSAFDSCKYYAEKTGKELRVAKTNPHTGGVDIDEIIKLIDRDTALLSVIFASNISGAVLDIAGIVKAARAIKPDIYIITDSVQHVPHGIVDVDALNIDGMCFAPYKFFGVRGSGIGYVSDRVCGLPHHRLLDGDSKTWRLGSPAPAHYAAITKILDYVCWLGANDTGCTDRRALFEMGMSRIRLQERALMRHMLEGTANVPGLRHIPGVKVFFDTRCLIYRDFITAMAIDRWGYAESIREFERRGIIVFERVNSSIYSARMLESFDMDGCIRISPLHCNTTHEIDEFLKAAAEMADSRM